MLPSPGSVGRRNDAGVGYAGRKLPCRTLRKPSRTVSRNDARVARSATSSSPALATRTGRPAPHSSIAVTSRAVAQSTVSGLPRAAASWAAANADCGVAPTPHAVAPSWAAKAAPGQTGRTCGTAAVAGGRFTMKGGGSLRRTTDTLPRRRSEKNGNVVGTVNSAGISNTPLKQGSLQSCRERSMNARVSASQHRENNLLFKTTGWLRRVRVPGCCWKRR